MTNQLSYTEYDFDSLVTQLQNRLKLRDAWKDIYISSTGEMVIEFYAYVANLVLYYIERRAEEGYLDTAQNYSSVLNLVKLINYSPRRKTSSTGTLTFSIAAASTTQVNIPIGTVCKRGDGVEYVVGKKAIDGSLIGSGYILVGDTSVDIEAIQGKIITREVTANGALNQTYLIKDTETENDVFMVYVDSVLWTKKTTLISSEPEEADYKLIQQMDNSLMLIFGDNYQGKAPSLGAVILIKYIRTDGASGNVLLADNITTLESTILDADDTAVTVTVTNDETTDDDGDPLINKFLGGSDEQSITDIKSNAPSVFATGDRAVTKADFIAILENTSGIANANVWGEAEESAPNYDMYNTIRLCIMMDEWQLPDSSQEAKIAEDLYDVSMMTVKYEFIDPVIIYIIPTLDATIYAGESLTETSANIIAAILARFELGVTTKLGTDKQISNLVRIVDALAAVKFHHMVLEARQELGQDDSASDYSDTLKLTTVLSESVRVFVDDDEIGIDDGAGTFTTTDSSYTFTGTINYTTGAITLDFTPDTTGTVYVRYQQDEDGDIVVSTRQICRLYNDTSDITSISLED